jgi:ribonuclease HI
VVFLNPFEYSKGFKKTTNNRMEILAVLVVLRSIKSKIDTLTIYTDSMYVIGCATLGWKRNKNLAMWNMFDSELARVSKLCPNIQFQHVKGHSNNQWNNYVDKLAVNASQELL